MANETKYFKTPFAESGTRTEVPNASVGGAVGFDTGFGSDYELPQGSAGRKRIERDKYNGLHHSITKNLKQWQEHLYPTWIEDDGTGVAFAYPVGMIVNHNGQNWASNEAANLEEPGTGTKWDLFAPLRHDLMTKESLNAVGGHDAIYSRNFKTVANLKAGIDATGQTINMALLVGFKVSWRGYYSESDGGSNWGIVKTGAHTDDGGSIFSIDANTYVQANLKPGKIHARKFGAKGDDSFDDLPYLIKLDAWMVANGNGDIRISNGIFRISNPFTLSANNGLIGAARVSSRLKQIDDSKDILILSGGNRVVHVRLEAPVLGANTTTKGLVVTGTADNEIQNVRILYTGYGVYGTGLLWRHSYDNVRVEDPRNTGFYFNDLNNQLEMYLTKCYVVNNAALGLTNKISYFIRGSKGTYLNNCTSDGGSNVGRKNFGAVFELSNIVMTVSHWEGYDLPTALVSGVEMNSLIRVTGGSLDINNLHVQSAVTSSPANAAIIYGEDSARITYKHAVVSTDSFNSFSTQHVGLSNTFGENLCECLAGQRDLVLAQAGAGSGNAQFTRKGVELKDSTSVGPFTLNVNTVGSIFFTGASGDFTGFTGAHSDRQQVRTVSRNTGVTMIHSGALKLQGGVNFVETSNAMHIFEYSEEGGFWAEVSRIL